MARLGRAYPAKGVRSTYQLTNKVIIAGAGSYAITGAAAALTHKWIVGVGVGSYAITGTNAALRHGYAVPAGVGSYTITGTAAALTHKWALPAGAGSYAITGTDAALTLVTGKTLTAGAGSYAITGAAASLLHGWIVAAGAGSYSITGSAVTLAHGLPAPPPPLVAPPQGSIGSGGTGGAHWERAHSSDGARPGQLSVREQNAKERRELEEIERELERQELITARNAEMAELRSAELAKVKALAKEAKGEAEQVTAMAAAFARAGLVLPNIEEPIAELFDEEEEEILMILAALH